MHAVCTLPARCPTKTLCGVLEPEGVYVTCMDTCFASCMHAANEMYACCEHYQDYYTTLLQLGAYLWPCERDQIHQLIIVLDV